MTGLQRYQPQDCRYVPPSPKLFTVNAHPGNNRDTLLVTGSEVVCSSAFHSVEWFV